MKLKIISFNITKGILLIFIMFFGFRLAMWNGVLKAPALHNPEKIKLWSKL